TGGGRDNPREGARGAGNRGSSSRGGNDWYPREGSSGDRGARREGARGTGFRSSGSGSRSEGARGWTPRADRDGMETPGNRAVPLPGRVRAHSGTTAAAERTLAAEREDVRGGSAARLTSAGAVQQDAADTHRGSGPPAVGRRALATGIAGSVTATV